MKTIHLARGLTLPAAELATKVTGAFGIRGSGKSSLMSLVIEQLLDAKIQVIVVDPVGVHFAVRLDATGKHPSPYQIPVLGGRHGDIALAPTTGAVVGRALALSNDSCVLDISSMSKGERIRFSGVFFEAFYEGKKENPAPVLLCLEEAQRFAPQIMFKGSGQEQMLGAVEELAEQGRNFGAGMWLNSLRPQKINKDVTSLMDLVFGFRLTGVHERKAVKEWLQEKGAEGREEIDGELPSLQAGHAFVWSPAVFNVFGKYHINRKTTYDAGATPLYARAKVKMKALDLDELESQMTAVVEEAKQNDPRALKAKIAELEREIAKGPKAEPTKNEKPKPVLKESDLNRVDKLADKLFAAEREFIEAIKAEHTTQLDRVSQCSQAVVSEVGNLQTALARLPYATGALMARKAMSEMNGAPASAPIRGTAPGRRSDDTPRLAPAHQTLPNGTPALSRCARKLLEVLAPRGVATDSQISILSGYRKTSSSFANGLSELRTQGLIDGNPDRRTITQAGREAAGEVEPLPQGEKLLGYWLGRLSKAEATMLKIVYERRTISREELSQISEYSLTSSSFANAVSGLRTLELVHGPNGGDLTIADVFKEG